ncbi:acetate/propionate family kinase [Lentilactobacillus buchneri]|uniref:Acetate kinase n=1 Tax=Lentilactobacillus buchneri subsp. silagei CD034 TaxID=1071400 RepID=J9WAV7_LENBU|nr:MULTISPECIES: acetate/propionate family kinase [Lentilactobacillus]MCC6101496.1 acetate/propionate family kinase [Lactobacillus sp.]AFS01181.1 Acetate kinase [Lentilactobacillus buchneri subsp. silagei CD034]MCT2901336.1 acetate/propionate family kinase [Lentilactobacillus buchneri]MCT3541722.1 acetate/propionate family kinase [Lentilactobacillus buchneri]MCT3543887.1 acetate/propionate family kinase [Lentilactobacillus buchneri]
MSKVLIVNAGSSSLKFKLFEMPQEKVLADGEVERLNMPGSKVKIKYGDGEVYKAEEDKIDYERSAGIMLNNLKDLGVIDHLRDIDAIGNRVVAGSDIFDKVVKIDDDSLSQIVELGDIAPIHNPVEAEYIEIIRRILPDTDQYAIFDSAFFKDVPEVNSIYGIPYELTQKFTIRRYGEHGINHGFITQEAEKALGNDHAKLVTLHLGSGASVAAEKDGKCYDTSMGFTPMNGLVMGTRSGDVDPALVPFFMKKMGASAEEVIDMFNKRSGLLGVSGVSSDMRDLEDSDDDRAKLALDMFVNRTVKYAASYITELGGVDAIVFSGGIGEHDKWVREQVVKKLEIFGIKLDGDLNEQQKPGDLGTKDSSARILLIPANEELAMVRDVAAAL